MFSERQVEKLRELLERTKAIQRQLGPLMREINATNTDALGIDLLLTGPAQDVRAKLSDASLRVGDVGGHVKEAEVALARLLGAPELAAKVAQLGWNFEGWTDHGWTAWYAATPGGTRDVQSSRTAAGLLVRIETRKEVEARHE